jgi:hypothetical protein
MMMEIAKRGAAEILARAPDEETFFKTAFIRYTSKAEAPMEEKTIATRWGVLHFVNREPTFGGKAVIFFREHGDLGCPCKNCWLASLVGTEEGKGVAL